MKPSITWSDYQEVARQWLRDHDQAGLFSGMGLGKTLIVLSRIKELIEQGLSPGVLVVAPLRVGPLAWRAQINHWEDFSGLVFADMRTEQGRQMWEDRSAHVYFINFDVLSTREVPVKCPACKGSGVSWSTEALFLLFGVPAAPLPCRNCRDAKSGKPTGMVIRKDIGFVQKFLKPAKYRKPRPVNALVIDELSTFKDHSGKRAATLRAWYKFWFKYVIALTGTPAENSYMDLFNEIRMIDLGERLGTSITAFREEYFKQDDKYGYKWKLRKGAKEKIDAKISDLCLVQRTEDFLDIPEVRIEDVDCQMPEKAWEQYRELEREMLVELETGEITALSAAALATKMLQWTGGCVYDENREVHRVHKSKITELKKLRKKHAGEPMLVLTAYQHEMARVLEEFPEAVKFHEDLVSEWMKGKIPMFVANCKSLSHGIDGLQRGGRIAVWMTLPYGGGTYLQTNARLARRGQTRETIIYRMVVKDSIDEAVAATLQFKNDQERGLMEAVKLLQELRNT